MIFFVDRPESEILIIHSIEYLILFVALLPIARRCFLTLLPADAFFDNRPQSYYIALMPFVLVFGHLLLWADERHNRAMRDNQRQMEELQKNLRAEYEMIARRLRAGDLDGVRAHINRQDALIDSTKIIEFCRAPLINAAISIYIQQAERHRIKCRHKINLPPTLSIDEND